MIVKIKEKGLTTQRAVAEDQTTATVAAVCTELAVSIDSIEINDRSALELVSVVDGDTIDLTPNWVEVTILVFGGGTKVIGLEKGSTIADAGTKAGVTVDGYEIRITTSKEKNVEITTTIDTDCRITVGKKSKGN